MVRGRTTKATILPGDFADWRDIPSETLQRKELRDALKRGLASLDSKYREVPTREVSNYIDEATDPELRARMEAHFKVCKHCSVILDGTRNIVKLIADDAEFELSANLGQRIYAKSWTPTLGNPRTV